MMAGKLKLPAAQRTLSVATESEMRVTVRGIAKAARRADPAVSVGDMTVLVSIGDMKEAVKVTANRTR